MAVMKNMRRTLPAAILLALGATHVCAQEPLAGPELLRAPGETVSTYRDAPPLGATRRAAPPSDRTEVVGYAIERIEFQQPRSVRSVGADKSVVARQAWRVRVFTKNLAVRSAPVTVWIGDKLVGPGVESPDLASVVAVTTDASLIASGQPVSISYRDRPDPSLTAKEPVKLDKR
jgi:hypothetical protein